MSDAPTPARRLDPVVAAAGPARWRAWALRLVNGGQERLAAAGLVLLLGLASGACALVVLAYLAEEVLEGEVWWWDLAVLKALSSLASPTLDAIARACSLLGAEGLAGLMVLLLGLLVWRRRWGAAVALVLVVVGAQLLNNVLKGLFHRTRPAPVTGIIPVQEFSFPSGHAMVAAAFYLYLTYLAWRLLAGWRRTLVVSALLLVVCLVGLSRLYLGVHYPSDVVAGYLAGFLWTGSVASGGLVLARRRARVTARDSR